MHHYLKRLIAVEEDLWIQTKPSIKPVSEKDGAFLITTQFIKQRHNRIRITRRTCFFFEWLIQEQLHQMMTRWDWSYLLIEESRYIGSNYHIHLLRSGFRWMITQGYLHLFTVNSILSRVMEPMYLKTFSFSLKLVSEGRSIHSLIHSFSLRIVNVFL